MIAELLREGKENRKSFRELQQQTGIKDVRRLRKIIELERRQGALILSCASGGYFLPANREEVEQYDRMMRKEAKSILYTLKPCREFLKATENYSLKN